MTELDRYGIEWQGADKPICVPMNDGYWTPWHEANAAVRKLKQKLDDSIQYSEHLERIINEKDGLISELENDISAIEYEMADVATKGF